MHARVKEVANQAPVEPQMPVSEPEPLLWHYAKLHRLQGKMMCSFPYLFLVNVSFSSYFSQYILATAQVTHCTLPAKSHSEGLRCLVLLKMWLHKDFTFLLLFFFYPTAPVESQWNLFSGTTRAGQAAFCLCLSYKSNSVNRGGAGFCSGSHFVSRTVNEVPAFSPALPH